MKSFAQHLEEKTRLAQRWVRALSPKGEGPHSLIYEAAGYSVGAGGKRTRPVIALAFCALLDGREEDVLPLACAVEYIHTYSLIHDDLPCMDNDDLRRGKPACHIAFGEDIALLAGDALLSHAFETVAASGLPAQMTVAALRVLSAASGAGGMIGGQVIDMKGPGSYDELITLYRMKTGALITAAGQLGVLASGKSTPAHLAAAREYTDCIGIAFQIKDDLLDVQGTEGEVGKRVGHDAATGKTTAVGFLGTDGARLAMEEYTRRAKESLAPYGGAAAFLLALADHLAGRKR